MKKEDRRSVTSIIEANTKRVTVNQLAAEGKRHVRVISGRKVLELIERVVDQAISRRSGEVAQEDRDRIVQDARAEFEKAAAVQARTEDLLAQQKALLSQQTTHIKEIEGSRDRLHEQLLTARKEAQKGAKRLERQSLSLQESFELLQTAGKKEKKLSRSLVKMERRLGNARDTIENYDVEIERLSSIAKDNATLIDELQANLRARDEEVQRLQGLLRELDQEIKAARERQELAGVKTLRDELAEMKSFMAQSLASRNSGVDEAALESMLSKLQERESINSSALENRFKATMDETLSRIGKTIHAATARPLDRTVEATDVYISKVFDDEGSMESNLQDLEVKVFSARQGISNSLDRLKQLRQEALGGAGAEMDDEEFDQASP